MPVAGGLSAPNNSGYGLTNLLFGCFTPRLGTSYRDLKKPKRVLWTPRLFSKQAFNAAASERRALQNRGRVTEGETLPRLRFRSGKRRILTLD